MSEPRVIQADYASWRPVAGRKVLQLVFEVGIEQTEHVMKMLGVPIPGESRWCAIALLEQKSGEATAIDPEAGTQKPSTEGYVEAIAGEVQFPAPATNSKAPRPFSSLRLSQQAAMLADDPEFQAYIIGLSPYPYKVNSDNATTALKEALQITSRRALDDSTATGFRFLEIVESFNRLKTDNRYAGSRK